MYLQRLYRPTNLLVALLFVVFPALIGLVSFGVGFNGLYGQDGFGYIQFTEAWSQFFTTGVRGDQGFITWPPLYAIVGAMAHVFLGLNVQLFFQVSSLVLFGAAGYFLYLTVKRMQLLSERSALLLVGLFFMCSPYMIRQSTLVMSDLLCVLLIILTYYQLLRWKRGGQFNLLLVFVFAALAVLTRYGAFFLVAAPCGYAVYASLRQKQYLILALGVGLGLLCLVPLLGANVQGGGTFVSHPFLNSWNPLNFFRSSFTLDSSTQQFSWPNIVFVASLFGHPGYLVAGLLLLPFYKHIWLQRNWLTGVGGLSILIYLFFLAGTPFQNPRYLLLAFPVLVLLLPPALHGIQSFVSEAKWRKVVAVAAIATIVPVAGALSIYSIRTIWTWHQQEKQIGAFLQGPPRTIYSYGLDVSLRYYAPNHTYYSYHETQNRKADYKRGDNVFIDKFSLEGERKNQLVAEAWEHLENNYELLPIGEFGDKWTLYMVKGPLN